MVDGDNSNIFSKSVLLEVSSGGHNAEEDDTTCGVCAADLRSEEWESLVAETRKLAFIRFLVDRGLLSRHSTYFKGYRNFREAECGSVNVKWDLPIFCILLQCIHGVRPSLSSSVIAPLLQGATYFGVEEAITECKEWAASTLCKVIKEADEDFLLHLPSIWQSAIDNGVSSIKELCVRGLAINFVDVVYRDDFMALPFLLLEACFSHPELTVQSEKQLCESLLLWHEHHTSGLYSLQAIEQHNSEEPVSLFKMIQLFLLPYEYLLGRIVGKYSPRYFQVSTIAGELHKNAVEFIFGSRGENTSKTVGEFMEPNPFIRLTEHLQVLDLAGCPQVTVPLLFTSASQALKLHKRKTTVLTSIRHGPEIPQFKSLGQLSLSQCLRINQNDLLSWLEMACPNLRVLHVSNCPQIQIELMSLTALPKLNHLDLSMPEELVELEGAVTKTKVRVLETTPSRLGYMKSICHTKLMGLSLRGRSEVTDASLGSIALNYPSLQAVDFSGCVELTDKGIAAFVMLYTEGFKEWRVAGTAFGPASCTALRCSLPLPGSTHATVCALDLSLEKKQELDTLDLEKCSGVDSEDLHPLLEALPGLLYLSLGFTRTTDFALGSFFGTKLELLNIRETKVSGGLFSRLVATNPALKHLNARGCTNLMSHTVSALHMGEGYGWENVEMGWGLSDAALKSVGYENCRLQGLVVGVGATISDVALVSLSEQCRELNRLSLRFQVLADECLGNVFRNLKHLHTLELQNSTQISRDTLRVISASCGLSLRTLKLVRVTAWLADEDILFLTQRVTSLRSLTLVGCQSLTSCPSSSSSSDDSGGSSLSSSERFIMLHAMGLLAGLPIHSINSVSLSYSYRPNPADLTPERHLEDSLSLIGNSWRGLKELMLEDCNKLITPDNALLLLTLCQALQGLHMRHTGKGLPEQFVVEASMRLPLLQNLAVDLCDSVADAFSIPSKMQRGALRAVYVARCRSPKHAFHRVLAATVTPYLDQIHKDTKVLEWNNLRLQESTVSERVTFE